MRRLLPLVVTTTVGFAALTGGVAPAAATLVPLKTGTPGAPVGVNPELTGPAGFAIEQGKGQAILAQYGYKYAGNVGFLAGPPAVQSVVANQIQIAVIGSSPAISARASGTATRAISLTETRGGYWIVAPKGGVTSFAQLKGKKIGSAFGTNLDQYLRYALHKTKMTNQVQLSDIQTQNAYPALISHSIDAYAASSTEAVQWLVKGGIQVVQKAEKAYPTFASSSTVLVSQSFLTQHPNIQKAWWALYNEGQTLIKHNRNAYLSWVAKQNSESLADAKITTSIVFQSAPVTKATLAAAQSTLQFLLSQQLVKSSFPLGKWAVNAPASASQG